MADNSSSRKHKKRAVLTTVVADPKFPLTPLVPRQTATSSTAGLFDYLSRWQETVSNEDNVIEWDKEGWDEGLEEDEDEDDDDDDLEQLHSPSADADATNDQFVYNGLDAEEASIRQARCQARDRPRKVALEKVVKIINGSIETFVDQWTPGKGSELTGKEKERVFDPMYLCEEAEARSRRQELIEKYRFEIEYFKDRLDRLSDEICNLPNSSEKDIRQQCKNLEVHAHNLEEAKWYLSVYELPPLGNDNQDTDREEPVRQDPQSEVIDLGSSPESSNNEETKMDLDDKPSIKPLLCSWPGCTKRFEENWKLKRHIVIHSDARPYICPACNYSAKRKDYLHLHLQTTHGWTRDEARRLAQAAAETAAVVSNLYPRDDRELIVDAEQPGSNEMSMKSPGVDTQSAVTAHERPSCGYETKRKEGLQHHIEREHERNGTATGTNTAVVNKVSTGHHRSDIEMDLHSASHVPISAYPARELVITRKPSSLSESEIMVSIEPDAALFSPTAAPRPQRPQKAHGSRPEIASIFTISKWSMEDLIASKDRKRIIMKVFLDMNQQEREMIRSRIKAVRKANLLREIRDCINMIYQKEERILGVLTSDLPKIKAVTSFFLCWWLAGNYMNKAPTDEQLHELVSELSERDDLETFYHWVHLLLHKTFTEEAFRNAHAPSEEEVIVISDDERPPAPSSHRKVQAKRPRPAQRVPPPQDVILLD
ncbi:hypothetical protein BU23DRAFT_555621 [Bimuria novae-zelandiae CBS 107.79]|uniref:C2H2-type domain-containing protein n=1 Tax=Bimuria novae-zelandiae CBS 107.79 TaxID=1447943 RepID=A0A6A5V420_9PLEO|nr:hypothetical protein BU23DRAFT_555621 [Bimuria novae-zelandiae CBS 107.79]